MSECSNAELEYGVFYGDMLYAMPPFKDPLIEHVLYERDVVCISSAPGVGKSILALQMLCNLTTGTPLLNTYNIPRPMNVLYVQSEGDRAETLERINMMRYGMKIDNERWAHINIPGTQLNVDEHFNDFFAQTKQPGMKYDVIMIDPLYTTVKGSLSEDKVATDWIRNMRSLKSYYECAMIVWHHDGKDQYSEGVVIDKGSNNTFGSVFWQAFFNHNFKLRVKKGVHTLECGKQRSGKIVDRIDMIMKSPKPLMYDILAEDSDNNTMIVKHHIYATTEPISAKKLVEATGISKSTIYRILKKLQLSMEVETFNDSVQVLYRPLKKRT